MEKTVKAAQFIVGYHSRKAAALQAEISDIDTDQGRIGWLSQELEYHTSLVEIYNTFANANTPVE